MKVQREVLERMLHLEAHELHADREVSAPSSPGSTRRKGLSADLAERVATELSRDPAVAIDAHAREELGIDAEEGLGNPWGAAASSFAIFCIGAFIPLVPFLFAAGAAAAMAASVCRLA